MYRILAVYFALVYMFQCGKVGFNCAEWYVKNETSQTVYLKATFRSTPKHRELPVGDSLIIMEALNMTYCPTFRYIYQLPNPDSEFIYEILDEKGVLLKRWEQFSASIQEKNPFYEVYWDYFLRDLSDGYHKDQDLKYTWVFTLTDEDLKSTEHQSGPR